MEGVRIGYDEVTNGVSNGVMAIVIQLKLTSVVVFVLEKSTIR